MRDLVDVLPRSRLMRTTYSRTAAPNAGLTRSHSPTPHPAGGASPPPSYAPGGANGSAGARRDPGRWGRFGRSRDTHNGRGSQQAEEPAHAGGPAGGARTAPPLCHSCGHSLRDSRGTPS